MSLYGYGQIEKNNNIASGNARGRPTKLDEKNNGIIIIRGSEENYYQQTGCKLKTPFTIITPIRVIIDYFAWLVSQYFTGKHPMPPVPPSTGKPLFLFLHGYGGSVRNFYWLYQRLNPEIGNQYDFAWLAMDPGMGDEPEQNAFAVVDFLQQYGVGERDIHIMGHSAGGLVGRCYLHLPEAGNVRSLIMTGTPNGGVNVYNLLPIHWLRSAGFDKRFNAPYPPKPHVRHLLLTGHKGINALEGFPNDNVVGRWSAKQFPPEIPLEHQDFPVNHWEIVENEAVAQAILEFLQQGERARATVPG